MRTIAEYKSVSQAAAANKAFGKYVQVDVHALATGDWVTSTGEPVFLRYVGAWITKFGRKYVTATIDGKRTQMRPDGGVIKFKIDA
jgi:hypothetical protein